MKKSDSKNERYVMPPAMQSWHTYAQGLEANGTDSIEFRDGEEFFPVSIWKHQSPANPNEAWDEMISSNEDASIFIVIGMTDTGDEDTVYKFFANPEEMAIYLELRKRVEMGG